MTALEDLVQNENLVAFQIGDREKREVAGKSANDLKFIVGMDLQDALDTKTKTLEAYKGKKAEIKVFLEKDGVKAEDTYTIEFAK